VASRALQAAVLLVLLSAGGCEETNPVFVEFGTTRVAFTDPGLLQQGIKFDPDQTIQGVEWKINEGTVRVGEDELDLLAGTGCVYVDGYLAINPGSIDRCASGLVVTAGTEPVQVTLDVTFTMLAIKARGFPLPAGEDHDNDAIPNEIDRCPLVPDRPDSKGVPCLGDWDGDGTVDPFDNCVWVANKDQQGSGLTGLVHVGNECAQVAPVLVGGEQVIHLQLGPLDVVQPLRQLSSLTVDFNNLPAVTCDWDAGVCELDPSQVVLCAIDDFFAVRGGCPRE